jgi:hypothetical protein
MLAINFEPSFIMLSSSAAIRAIRVIRVSISSTEIRRFTLGTASDADVADFRRCRVGLKHEPR